MTDVPPRRRIITLSRVLWTFLILCGAGAAWVYEAGAFDRAERAELKRRGAVGVFWPKDAYAANLRKVRDPRAAEKAMPDADSVSYFLHQRADGPVLGQVFHLTLRQGLRRWRRQLTVIYDEYPAPERIGTNHKEPPGPPLTRQAALAWYDDWLAGQHKWRTENAHRLPALKVNLLLLGGALVGGRSEWLHLQPDSMHTYRGIMASIYRFGDAGVEMLVDCLDDAGPTTTRRVADAEAGAPVPLGIICYHHLKDLVRFEDEPQEGETIVVDGGQPEWLGDLREPADAARLAAGEAAWRARMKRGNFHFERPTGI